MTRNFLINPIIGQIHTYSLQSYKLISREYTAVNASNASIGLIKIIGTLVIAKLNANILPKTLILGAI